MSAPRTLLAVLLDDATARWEPPPVPSEHATVLVLDDRGDRPSEASDHDTPPAGVATYRPPRRLGPARAMNVVLAWAVSTGHDAVLFVPPGSTVPGDALAVMAGVAAAGGDRIGFVVPWASDGSALSLTPAAAGFGDGKAVEWISDELQDEFGAAAVDVSTTGSGCLLLPLAAVAAVGLFDPVFRHGPAHLLDWQRRAAALGYHGVLAPGAFVPSGAAEPGRRRPPALRASDETILAFRHPARSTAATAEAAQEAVAEARARAARRVVVAAARSVGYSVQAGWLPRAGDPAEVQLVVRPDGDRLAVTGHAYGIEARLDFPNDADLPKALEVLIGSPPTRITIFERGRVASQLAAATWNGETPFVDHLTYPARI